MSGQENDAIFSMLLAIGMMGLTATMTFAAFKALGLGNLLKWLVKLVVSLLAWLCRELPERLSLVGLTLSARLLRGFRPHAPANRRGRAAFPYCGRPRGVRGRRTRP
ncbi:MAG: hypothetical protein KKE29_21435 [Proteobacteria bacterium]|nr:hypothetical protein [Pseudomonadota bacterium]MBU4577162.1 hypothetical protein [Pseudomonadota bacterium]MBU4599136.1 hypothetical protein [Pseudomonadota bacterium]